MLLKVLAHQLDNLESRSANIRLIVDRHRSFATVCIFDSLCSELNSIAPILDKLFVVMSNFTYQVYNNCYVLHFDVSTSISCLDQTFWRPSVILSSRS